MGMDCDEGDQTLSFMHVLHFILVNCFQVFLLYFVFGALEMYHALSEIWASGLVLENYMGIIDLICSPLQPNIASRPLTFADISSTLDEGGNISTDDPSSSTTTKMANTFIPRSATSRTLMVEDMDEELTGTKTEDTEEETFRSFTGVRQRSKKNSLMIDDESFAKQRSLRRGGNVNFNESSYIMDTNLNC